MAATTSNEKLKRTSFCKHAYFLLVMLCLPWLRCLKHVINLANVAVMGHITKIAIIENTNMIWEYDPELLNNYILGGSLDIVVAIQTLTIKVCMYINNQARFNHIIFMLL